MAIITPCPARGEKAWPSAASTTVLLELMAQSGFWKRCSNAAAKPPVVTPYPTMITSSTPSAGMSSFEARSIPLETPIATTPTVSTMNTECQVSSVGAGQHAVEERPGRVLSMPAKAPVAASAR